jgi:hypothetical protein
LPKLSLDISECVHPVGILRSGDLARHVIMPRLPATTHTHSRMTALTRMLNTYVKIVLLWIVFFPCYR